MCRLHSGFVTSEDVEEPRPQRWSKRQALAAAAVAVMIGGVGGAAIYAATEGSPHAMAGAMRGQLHGPPPGSTAPAQGAPPGQQPADTLHGEYVVSDGQGGFTTKMTQTGTVDEVTPSEVVVRSDDGFTQIYAFPSSTTGTNASVAANDVVTVEATRTGATVTLNRIGEGQPPAK